MLDKELLKLIGKNKKYVFYVVSIMLLSTLANLGITACVCWCLYLLSEGSELQSYILPGVLILVAVAIRFISSVSSSNLRDLLGRKVKKDLRQKTYDKILTLGAQEAEDMSMAGLTQVSLEGIEQLDLYYSSYLPQFFYAMIAPVILFIICVGIDWRVSLALILCVPLIPISIVAVSKYAKRIFAKYWGKYISMGDVFLDSVQGLKELKIFKSDEEMHKKINKSAEEFRVITMKVLVMQLASITIMDLVAFGGAGIGIAFAVNGAMSGLTTPFMALYLILVAVEFFLPLRSLGSAFHVAMNGASAGRKIISLLKLENPKWGDKDIENTDVEIKDVTFSYDGKRDVLKKVNVNFKHNNMTAIVGESGCGKSTIVNLMTGGIRAKSGEVRVGNVPIDELSREKYYSHLAVVSYNTYIFNESVRDNFRLAKEDVTDEEIFDALKQVNLDNFIIENGGLDKTISEDATNISGGQKQRLALAVNLVAHKDIYVFDEATSNIDIVSEGIIMQNIKKISENATVVVISHRLENIVPADVIYFMKDGEVLESGTHDDLMKNGQGYAKLYTAQKELEDGYKKITEKVGEVMA